MVAQLFFAQFQQRLRRVRDLEQVPRRGIHADVSGLRRVNHRDQQLEWRGICKLGGGVRVGGLEAHEDFAAYGGVHGIFVNVGWVHVSDEFGCDINIAHNEDNELSSDL